MWTITTAKKLNAISYVISLQNENNIHDYEKIIFILKSHEYS